MDDFNNFFDDQREQRPEPNTPIYHTPTPKNHGGKINTASIICIVIAAVMCIVVLVNVIVLASLKQTIADEYADQISANMREQYRQAIEDALNKTDVVEDVTNSATEKALEALTSTVGQVANKKSASVARLYMYESAMANPSTTSASGVASGFLITDTDESGTAQRYLLTNAHCVRYVKKTRTGLSMFGSSYEYVWTSYGKIICTFEDSETSYYELEIVAYGSYNDENKSAENDQADIALLRIKGMQPSNETHPSLKIASSDYTKRGDAVALIGNPEGVGETNSVTTGTVSQTGISIASWGAGKFLMTDAAVNGGNSGGPMVDILGTVVGIVESKLVDESIDNMGFALSAGTIMDFIEWAEKSENNIFNKALTIDFKVV